MHISTFFSDLHSAYSAELDDLRTDSDGANVLRQRLAEKRKELAFLLQMVELSPEMVAPVLHGAFRFLQPSVMEQVLKNNSAQQLPAWSTLAPHIEVAAWAQPIVAQIDKQHSGFTSLVAALEYLQSKPVPQAASDEASDHDTEDSDENAERENRHDDSHTDEDDAHADADERDARQHEEAANRWLTEQGFDSKD